MLIIAKGVADATVTLQCPHCGSRQLRAKKRDKQARYACRQCHKRFKLAEGRRRG